MPQSPELGGGEGFTFEGDAAAFYLTALLAEAYAPGIDDRIVVCVSVQQRDFGEPLDDVIVDFEDAEKNPARLSLQVKRSLTISDATTNTDFRDIIRDSWATLKKTDFRRTIDRYGAAVGTITAAKERALKTLCDWARESLTATHFEARFADGGSASAEVKAVKDDVAKLLEQTTGSPCTSEVAHQFLAHFVLIQFDFLREGATDPPDAINRIRDCLAPHDAAKAPLVWSRIIQLARASAAKSGQFDRARLVRSISTVAHLRDAPSDIAAWNSIRGFTKEWIGQIETTLTGGLTLPRKGDLDDLRKLLAANRASHVIGESGSGKSALMKALATENAASPSGAEIVWVKSDQFSRLLAAVPNFTSVLLRTGYPSAVLVFDALDACYSDETLTSIGQTIAALTSDVASPWKVVLICQTPEWSRVSRRLVKTIVGHDALTKRFQCGDLAQEDKSLVFAASPSIRRLASQPRISRMLSSPKTLDLLLRGQLQDNLNLAGEADLVDWWWEEQVKSGKQFAAEERIARKASLLMADELTSEVSPDVIEGPAEAVESLIKNRVLRRTRDGRLRFDHDLLADWSRVMHLRSLGDGALTFMRANTENPPWLRAIRLFSQHLLERSPDLERWRSTVSACSVMAKGGKEPPANDLQVLDAWLEGIAYCTDALGVLNSVRADLFAQNGWLLGRFTRRLLHTGTIPDPVIQQRFQQIDAEAAEAAAMRFRLPQSFLWQAVLDFLIANPDHASDLIPVELAEIGAMWARLEEYLNLPWPELAGLVLLNGEKELRREVAGEYRRDRGARSLGGGNKSRINIYSMSLQAASQLPDRAAKLVLKAAGRMPWEDGDVSEEADEEWRGEWHDRSFGHYGTHVNEPVESWPEGPSRRVSSDLFHAWFDGNAALPLFRLRPDAACEASLAFLIDWPKSEIIHGHHSSGVDRHGFRFDADHMYPAFWTKGPFLLFLRHNWRPALNLVIRLTNFATDRYEDWWPYEPGVSEVSITTPLGNIQWRGNHQVYAWNRYHMNTAQVVTCALMALEKWFDEQIDSKTAITDAVQLLYRQGRSLAFAGVLVSIGKRHPEKGSPLFSVESELRQTEFAGGEVEHGNEVGG